MSNDALNFAFRANLDPGPRFVLVVLADHGSDHDGEDWQCFPSVERLMARTGMSRATVERHLKALFAEGWVSRTRRRLPNGKLGIYDYVLHRDPDVRASLKAKRATGAADADVVEDDAAGSAADEGEPHVNLTCGPDVNLREAMPQIEGQPCINLMHQEPLVEPLVEPSQGAGAGARDGLAIRIARIWSAFPTAGTKGVSSMRLVEAAFLAEVKRGVDPDRLERAVMAYGRDPSAWGASGKPCSLHRALVDGRYETFLSAPGSASAAAVAETVGPIRFQGPAELRASFVAAHGEASAASWLDRCGWDGERRALSAATGMAADWLRRNAWAWLKAHGLTVERAGERTIGESAA